MKVGEYYNDDELMKATLKELRSTEYDYLNLPFGEIVIVPTTHKHSSGWGCMMFLLFNKKQLVGCLGGGCDVIHLNGIGGYGKFCDKLFGNSLVPRIGWKIDCLPRSKCLRIWCGHNMIIEQPHLVCSDFCPVMEGGDFK